MNIPVSRTGRKGTINIQDLYNGEKIIFQIPDAQWLVDNGWVHKSQAEEKVFYVRDFQLFVISQDKAASSRHILSRISALRAAPLIRDGHKQKMFGIKPTQEFEFDYRENIFPCSNKEQNPYELCEPLSLICNSKKQAESRQKQDLFPSVFSEWEIEIEPFRGSDEIPQYFEDGLYLQAKVSLCSKTPTKRPDITIESKFVRGKRSRCENGYFFDRKTFVWKKCPSGSEVQLGGYYCKPLGNSIYKETGIK